MKAESDRAYEHLFESLVKGAFHRFINFETIERYVQIQGMISERIDE